MFWQWTPEEAVKNLHSRLEGLTAREAKARLKRHGLNTTKPRARTGALLLFVSQFKSPLILILLFAAALSFILLDHTDALIIGSIVIASGILSYFQERGALNAVKKLLEIVQVRTMVLRGMEKREVAIEEVVPGDIAILNAGDMIPGDCLVLEARDFFVDEATLTGESMGVEKCAGKLPLETPLAKRSNVLYMGSHAISGWAKALVVHTGQETEFGKIADRLRYRPSLTAFEIGIRHFGYFLMEVTFLLVLAIFFFNIALNRSIFDSFLFALALAIGLTPQLLPAIVSVNLAHGARRMAGLKVIVKRLVSIENFGSMDILCSDKTGTLTKGIVELSRAIDGMGNPSEKALLYGALNGYYQTGYNNPLDSCLAKVPIKEINVWKKKDEIPFDFIRKRIAILVNDQLITKGAFHSILSICGSIEDGRGNILALGQEEKKRLEESYKSYSSEGIRLIAVAYKHLPGKERVSTQDEHEMIFLGFLLFFDPPKEEIVRAVQELNERGISLKVITGDNRYIASFIAKQIGLKSDKCVTGEELHHISDQALIRQVRENNLFAEIEPPQKERIILALKKGGHTVGFLGDGINDVTAIHSADVGISVDSAADVVKEVADIVLLQRDLSVIAKGVEEGRRTFANTLKYIFMATSANFGNMFSMAGVSLFLSFLPLLPKQILLTNLLTDFPEMAIATDRVDHDMVKKPLKWDIRLIRRFMVVFGLISSFFDFLTFGALLWVARVSVAQFRTGWFIESVFSAALIVLVIRTRKIFYKAFPSLALFFAVVGTLILTLIFPYTPLGKLFGFSPLPFSVLSMIGAIVLIYISSIELAKYFFFKKK